MTRAADPVAQATQHADRLRGLGGEITAELADGWRVDAVDVLPRDGRFVTRVIARHPHHPWSPVEAVRWMSPGPFVHNHGTVAEIAAALKEAIERREASHPCVRFALVHPDARTPTRAGPDEVGYDLYAVRGRIVDAGALGVVDTGVAVEMPRGIEAQVRPRGGLTRDGLWAALGTVDPSFRGAIGVIVANLTGAEIVIEQGDRVAQLVFARYESPRLVRIDAADLTESTRGDRGFGSTGR